MSMATVEKEIKNRIISNQNFGVVKFVDIGVGSGKLNNGVLQAEKLDKFIQAMESSTTFLSNIKMVPVDNDKGVVDTMSFNLELEAGRINGVPQVLEDDQNPIFLDRSYECEELRALTGIHRTALRRNIEGKGFMNTLTQQFGAACGRALERTLIYGDKSSSVVGVPTGFKVVDGAIKKLQDDGDNPIDEIDLTATDSNPIKEIRRIIDAMPDKYIEDGKNKLLVPESLKRACIRWIADNKDVDKSITYIEEKNQLSIEGNPLISVPAFSTLRNGYTEKPIIFTHEENLQYFINKENVIVEDDFNLRANKTDIASTVYADTQFAECDATSLAFLKESITPVPQNKVNVSIIVTDGTDPITGAIVTLTDADNNEYSSSGTGSAGGSTINNVPEGTYNYTATCTGYEDFVSTTPVSISSENKSLTITMVEE